ncbi:MAG: hypothetical protein ACM3MD_03845, partial [Betaproteobacteria bacterium]
MSFDKQITLTEAQLQDLGIQDAAQARKNLELLSTGLGSGAYSALLPAILANLSRAADPDMALNNLERFVSALTDLPRFVLLCTERNDILWQLITIFGASRFLSTFLVTSADDGLTWFADLEYLAYPAGKEALLRRLSRVINVEADDKSFYRAMRVFRKREMLRIG